MINVLFVCLGNICRSPLAEAVFRNKIINLGFDEMVACDSAGTANYHVGDLPDSRTIDVAQAHSIPIDHRGRQFLVEDSEAFDYLLAMDSSNYRNMISEMGSAPNHLFLMRHFDPLNKDADVPDPYYGGVDGFEKVYKILDRSIDEFIDFLLERHDLT